MAKKTEIFRCSLGCGGTFSNKTAQLYHENKKNCGQSKKSK